VTCVNHQIRDYGYPKLSTYFIFLCPRIWVHCFQTHVIYVFLSKYETKLELELRIQLRADTRFHRGADSNTNHYVPVVTAKLRESLSVKIGKAGHWNRMGLAHILLASSAGAFTSETVKLIWYLWIQLHKSGACKLYTPIQLSKFTYVLSIDSMKQNNGNSPLFGYT
jgi:hypothetical protein